MDELDVLLEAFGAAGAGGLVVAVSAIRQVVRGARIAWDRISQLMLRVEKALDDAETHRHLEREHWQRIEFLTHVPPLSRAAAAAPGNSRTSTVRSTGDRRATQSSVRPSDVPPEDGEPPLEGETAGVAHPQSVA